MPKGPDGQKRPADAVGMSVMVAKIATGEEDDTFYASKNRRKSGVAGAKARNANLTDKARSQIATNAAYARHCRKENVMSNGASQLNALLFEEGRELVNFKFLPGNERGLTADQMQGEAAKVIRSAMDKGPIHAPPMSGRTKRTL